MNNLEYTSRETASASPEGWSWAEKINTYRFWALLIFYIMSVAVSASPFRTFAPIVVVDGLSAGVSALGIVLAVYSFAAIPGVLLAWAWALSDWQPKRGLILFGLLQLIGVVFLGMSLSIGIWVFYVAAFISGLGFGAVFLTVPAVIAGGRAGVAAFVLVFGVILISEVFFGMIAQLAFGGLLDVFGILPVVTLIGALLLLGIFFLLPADPLFFSEPPPPRADSFPPSWRSPMTVALLALIPLYNVYHILRWLYLIHGEVAHLVPSRTMISPRAAIVTAFVPFLSLVSMATLIDHLNLRASQLDKPPYSSPLAMFLWSLLFFPLGMALTQSAVNRLKEPS